MHRLLVILAVAAVAVAAPSPLAPGPQVSYQGRTVTNADGSVNEAALAASMRRTLAKYRHRTRSPGARAKRAVGTVALTDETQGTVDELYYGTGSVGGTNFTLEFDTGNADFFVPGPACASADGCTGTTRYHNQGQDQHRTTTITYGSGQVSGEDYKDKVMVGGLSVPAQGFLSLTDAFGFAGSAAQGSVGMAFSTISQSGYPTFVENLIAQGALSSHQFSFYLGRALNFTKRASELTIGGADSARYCGTPSVIPVTTPGYWQLTLDAVLVNGKSAGPITAGQAAIDTATTIVLAPTAAAAAIFALIPGSIPLPGLGSDPSITFYAYPCHTLPRYMPVLQFAGKRFAISPLDFNLGTLGTTTSVNIMGSPQSLSAAGSTSTLCLAGVAAADIDPTQALYVVGDVFLKNWYSTYNYDGPSVSFAPAVHNNPLA